MTDFQASDSEAQAAWVYDLLAYADVLHLNVDRTTAPDAADVAKLIRDDFSNADTWPELMEALRLLSSDESTEVKNKLKSALDHVAAPPASQW